MQSALCFNVNSMSFFGGVKSPKEFGFPIDAYFGLPAASIRFDAKESAPVICPRISFVLHIDGLRNVAQVVNSVVRSVAVNVINVSVRPFAMNVEPNKSMSESCVTVNHKLKVASRWITGNLSSQGLPFGNFPAKDASLWVVGKKLVEPSLSDHAAPYQSGKPSKDAASGDESPVPRRVSCGTILTLSKVRH